MKVFISWSGNLSKRVAELLNEWLPNVIQSVEPWFSPEDIGKGEIWFGGINDALANTSYGILCLTKENLNASWVLFEAGALCKGLSKNRVCPLLIDLEPNDLKPPLSQFNATKTAKDEIAKLLQSINGMEMEKALPDERLKKSFDLWWPIFEEKLGNIFKEVPLNEIVIKRSLDDMTEEILDTVRSIQKKVQEPYAVTGVMLREDQGDLAHLTIQPKKTSPAPKKSYFLEAARDISSTNGIRVWAGEERESEYILAVSKLPSDELRTALDRLAKTQGNKTVLYVVNSSGTVPLGSSPTASGN